MKRNTLIGIVAGLSATSIWGGMYVVSKTIMGIIPPFSLISFRLILGILSLAVVVLVRRTWEVTWKQFWSIFWVGVVGYGISIGFQFIGTNLSSAANGSLVTSSTPAFVIFFAAIILKEKITILRLVALVIATLGVLAIIDPRSISLTSHLFLGNISLVAAALTWALYSVLIRKVTRQVDVLSTSLIAFIGGLPICLPLSVYEFLTLGIGPFTPGVIAGILFLGIISTALAMYLWNMAFAKLEAGVASLTFFAQPIVGTILGVWLLGESITPLFILGGILIGIGILVSSQTI